MPWAAVAPRTSSKYGRCQPPCWNPPSVSSSGAPGACITPSRDKNSITRSILMVHTLLFVHWHRAGLSPSTREEPAMTLQQRTHVASGSPYEPQIGFCRALRVGDRVLVSGTAPVWPDGSCDPDPGAQARRCLEIILAA